MNENKKAVTNTGIRGFFGKKDVENKKYIFERMFHVK